MFFLTSSNAGSLSFDTLPSSRYALQNFREMKRLPSWNFFRDVLRISSLAFLNKHDFSNAFLMNLHSSFHKSVFSSKKVLSIPPRHEENIQNNESIKKKLLHKVFEAMQQAFIAADRETVGGLFYLCTEVHLFMMYAMKVIEANYDNFVVNYCHVGKASKVNSVKSISKKEVEVSSVKICPIRLKKFLNKACDDYIQRFENYLEGAKRLYDEDEEESKSQSFKEFFKRLFKKNLKELSGYCFDTQKSLNELKKALKELGIGIKTYDIAKALKTKKYYEEHLTFDEKCKMFIVRGDMVVEYTPKFNDYPLLSINSERFSMSYSNSPEWIDLFESAVFRGFFQKIHIRALCNLKRSFFDNNSLLKEVFLQNMSKVNINGFTKKLHFNIADLTIGIGNSPYRNGWTSFYSTFPLFTFSPRDICEDTPSGICGYSSIKIPYKLKIEDTIKEMQKLGRDKTEKYTLSFYRIHKKFIEKGLLIFYESIRKRIKLV